MNEDTIADLKQFIASTISQEITSVIQKLDKMDAKLSDHDEKFDRIENRFIGLDQKLDDTAAGIGDAIHELTEHVEARMDDHETRITKLEHHAA